MTTLDWCLLWIPITCVIIVALFTTKYNKSVVDFIAAGRCAGRYLLATARGEAGSAAITAIALFQMTTKTGFAFQFWGPLYSSIPIIVTITGWVIYRYRETRSLSAGQFFETRYSRPFRLFMGGVAFLSGVLNYGVFPAVGSRFFVYYLELPQSTLLLGHQIATWQLIACAYLTCCLFFVLVGGQISILITDCLEGMFSQVAYLVIIVALLLMFGWTHMVQSLTAAPATKSMVNPFDMSGTQDFNIYFILIGLFAAVYGANIGGGFAASATTPHELRMAGILEKWRGFAFGLMRTILAICAITFLINPDFSEKSASAHAQINAIGDDVARQEMQAARASAKDPEAPVVLSDAAKGRIDAAKGTQDQMQVPIAVSHFLPFGIKGLFCAVMLMGMLTGDAGALHNYGTIFVQDIILPLRKKPMSPSEHLWLLRLAVVGVALFALVFSSLFKQTQYIQLYWQVTGAVYAGGAGSIIIGGLYWRKGTTAAAWVTIITGATISLTGIFLKPTFHGHPIHGQYVSLTAMLTCIVVYITVSLLTTQEGFNMDRMLHRGEYNVAGEKKKAVPTLWERFRPAKLIGVDEEFTFWDRVIAFGIFGWMMFTLSVMLCILGWVGIHGTNSLSTGWWVNYWFIFGLVLPFTISVITTVWFTIGTVKELGTFFRRLSAEKRDASDDGTVGPGHPV